MPVGGRSDEASPAEPGPLTVDYHPAASAELIEAARFYEARSDGLGHAFLDAVEEALTALRDNPMLGRPDACGRRKWLVRRFPYLIVYRVERPILHVLAIAHTSRKPNYWEPRDAPET